MPHCCVGIPGPPSDPETYQDSRQNPVKVSNTERIEVKVSEDVQDEGGRDGAQAFRCFLEDAAFFHSDVVARLDAGCHTLAVRMC